MNHTGDISSWEDLSPEVREEIEKLIPEGKRIQAIKVYRLNTNTTLKEARDSVDSIASGMGIEPVRGSARRLFATILIAISFAVFVLMRVMPSIVESVIKEIFGDSLSHGQFVTIKGLSSIAIILIPLLLVIIVFSRKIWTSKKRQGFPDDIG